jgi:hypothetical protein
MIVRAQVLRFLYPARVQSSVPPEMPQTGDSAINLVYINKEKNAVGAFITAHRSSLIIIN